MNDFEKQFQDKLTSQQSPLSPQDSSDLWDSISTELDSDADRAKGKRKRKRVASWMALAGLFAAIGWGVYPTEDMSNLAETVKEKKSVATEKASENSFMKADIQAASRVSVSTSERQNQPRKVVAAYTENTIESPPNDEVKVAATSAASPTQVSLKREDAVIPVEISLDVLEPQVSRQLSTLFGPVLIPFARPTDEQFQGHKPEKSALNVRIYQGPTWSQFKYLERDGADLVAKNKNMKAGGSWGFGGMIEFQAKNQHWGVGVEWNEYIHRLDYEGTFEEIMTVNDVLLEVELDPVTGDTLSTMSGMADVIVLAKRRVLHHNRLRAISIPIEWQKQWAITPVFQGEMALGALIHWRSFVNGRTFTGQEGIFSDYAAVEFPSNRFFFAPLVRGHLSYDLAPDWSVGLSFRVSAQKHASLPLESFPEQSGHFTGRLLTGNLHFSIQHEIH